MGRGLSAESRRLIQRAYDVLAVEHPSGVRRVAYALFGNRAGAYVKKLGALLVYARKANTIPWSWISDSTRPDVLPFVVNDTADMRDVHRSCPSFDPWKEQPVRVVIWSEKSVSGTLDPLLQSFLVPFCVHHGNTSWDKIRCAIDLIDEQHDLIVLYVGDHDPKGLRISEHDLPKRLGEYAALVRKNDRFRIRRVALCQADAELTACRDPFKQGDSDVRWYQQRTGLGYGAELESIPSPDLRDRIEAAIRNEIVNVASWNCVMNASKVVRESWQDYVDRWPSPTIPGLGPEYGNADYETTKALLTKMRQAEADATGEKEG